MKKIKPVIPLLIFATIYLIWFSYLESTVTKHYKVIHMKVDNYIPFCEFFIIPYLLWFVYVAIVVLYLLLKNETDYYKSCIFLFTGMTVFLIISTLWPNGHHLRPFIMPRNNLFTHLVSLLYKSDTPTNLWPSRQEEKEEWKSDGEGKRGKRSGEKGGRSSTKTNNS